MKSQLKHLFSLLDDSDHFVTQVVCNEILKFGPQIIPQVEEFAKNTADRYAQLNAKFILAELNLQNCISYFDRWQNSKQQGLIEGALVVAKFHNADLDEYDFSIAFNKLKQQVIAAGEGTKTSIEKLSALTHVFFKKNLFKAANHNLIANEFLIDKAMDSRIGNSLVLSIFLQSLAADLQLDLKRVYLPNKTMLAVLKPIEQRIICENAFDEIEFFYDPANGYVYSHKDIKNYLQKVDAEITNDFFVVQSNKKIINELIEAYYNFLAVDEGGSSRDEISGLKNLLNR
jgi:regulator of sirC expression with transglutaminase-like and TPR domain